MNVAVFGGSFDPPHIGHKRVVEEAIKVLDIDKLFVIPTYISPFKSSSYYSPNDRYEMVKKLLADADMKKVEILDYEIKSERSVPTYETILYLKEKYSLDKIYLIIGADNLKDLNKWHKYHLLKELVEFVVATRDGIDIPDSYKKLQVDEDISSTQIRRSIGQS